MKAFILAAGKGTRMRPLTERTPKPALPIGGKPIIQHLIDNLEDRVDEIIILVGQKEEEIKKSVRSVEAEVTYTRQDEPQGTADAISHAEEMIEDKFICINGDVIIPEKTLENFIGFFSEEDQSTIGMAKVDDPEGYGMVRAEGGEVIELIEKPKDPKSDFVNAGLYGFTENIFDAIRKTEKSSRGEYEITDSLKILIEKSQLKGFEMEKKEWYEVSRPWELLSVNKKIMHGDCFEAERKGRIKDNAYIEGEVHVAEGAVVKDGAYLEGPIYVDKNAEIGPNCYVRPATYIGKGCKVGNAVEIKNSIIMEGTQIPHHNYLGDSVIGKDCNFGSGTKVANLRLDNENIVVVHRGEKIDTERRKLGVIMGDKVKTGVNSMINPGTIIWQRCFIGPGVLAKSEIKPGSKIK